VALDARLTLIKRAQSSLDLQYYLLGNDEVGHLVLRELRDAANRGVRVRLLLDDFYTTGMDRLLLGLAAHPNVEVRLFNPFGPGRVSTGGRLLSLAADFKRLNHRMHNKLFIADGAVVVAGGRNLADGYFLRDQGANFIDFDVLAVGPIVPQLADIFDLYWNSPLVRELETVTRVTESPEDLRTAFEASTAVYARRAMAPPPALDSYGVPTVGNEIDAGLPHLIWAPASAYADGAGKALSSDRTGKAIQSAAYQNMETFQTARSEVMLFSPYFVPGEPGMKRLKFARDHNITVRVVTNSMASTDEPLAALAYERYRVPMLKMGVELYELSPTRVKRNLRLGVFGSTHGRLHAKTAVIDRETVFIGSMNFDPRSEKHNTEMAVIASSPALAREVLRLMDLDKLQASYRVRLAADGSGRLEWLGEDDDGERVFTEEPDTDFWTRFMLQLLAPLAPEELL